MSAFAATDPVRIYVDAMMELNAAADDLDALGQFHAWLGDQLQHHKQNVIDVSLTSPDQLVGDVVEQRYLDKTSFLDALQRYVFAWQRVETARDSLSAAERRAVGLIAPSSTAASTASYD
jgi:hypothetical protein